ncbi:MAG: histidine phosphatase family protein [Crocinitomicaceae bacterium]
MKLHLIRHAKTEQFSPTEKDFDRQLMKRGKSQGKELSEFLLKTTISESHVHCSSAARTRETLDYLMDNFQSSPILFHKELYLCSLDTYLKWIWSQNHGSDLVLIGHNFGISDLANYFLDTVIEIRTAEYICIEFPFHSWKETSRATGVLTNQFRPSAE